eukprot:scaffold414438_cov43-Prasinocladus_malaysianus.AAC.1
MEHSLTALMTGAALNSFLIWVSTITGMIGERHHDRGLRICGDRCRGSPTTFAPNQVIKGWTEAMQLMVEGDKWELYIPSDLAYGDGGSPPKIPGGATLVFTIEIIKINGDKVPALTCESKTGEGCNEKEKAFIDKLATKGLDAEALEKEIKRLQKMKSEPMKDELLNWLERRLRILQQKKDEL